jgi:hypothetical protein
MNSMAAIAPLPFKITGMSASGMTGLPVLNRPNLPDHGHMRPESQCARFQIVLKCNGVVQGATDVPFTEPDIGRLGFAAA